MYNPFTANAAPVAYNMDPQQAYAGAYSGYPVQANYGTVQYPPATTQYSNYSQQQQNSQMYSGLDAAVYSAATAMLAERGLQPPSKPYASTYSQNLQSGGSDANSSWKSRVEQMNPTVSTTSSAPRGGSTARGGRGSFRGGRGSFGGPGRGFPVKPKNPEEQVQHYCDICKIVCAGATSFKAHLVGAKHKRREEQAKQLSGPPAPAATAAPAASGTGATPAPPAPSVSTPAAVAAPPPPAAFPHRPGPHGRSIFCELCGVHTAGQQAYEAHLNGKSHQRTLKLHMKLGKPIPVNEPTVTQRTLPTIGTPTSSGPSTGSSICTKVVTGGKTVLITPKMNFVGGTVLTTTNTGMQEVPTSGAPPPPPAASAMPPPPPPPPKAPAQARPKIPIKHMVNPNTAGADPIGQEYVQKQEREGKVAYYKCTLCDCEFSDESGMNSHIRGRRHRTSYQKKVDPSIVVEPSNAQKKLNERNKRLAAQAAPRAPKRPGPPPGGPPSPPKRVRRPIPGPPQWTPPGPDPYGPPPMGYEPMGYEPYPVHHDRYGPPPGPYNDAPPPGPPRGLLGHYPRYQEPPGALYVPPRASGPLLPAPVETGRFPPGPGRMEGMGGGGRMEDGSPPRARASPVPVAAVRMDQQYLLHKHRAITPRAADLNQLNGMLVEVEKALKTVAERLMFPTEEKAVGVKMEEGAAVAVVAAPAPPQRMLKGAYRFGRMSKNLLTSDNIVGEVLLICNRHPCEDDMTMVANALKAELKMLQGNREFAVIPTPEKCGIFVQEERPGEDKAGIYPVWVYMAFGGLRDELARLETEKANAAAAAAGSSAAEGQEGPGSGAPPPPPAGALPTLPPSSSAVIAGPTANGSGPDGLRADGPASAAAPAPAAGQTMITAPVTAAAVVVGPGLDAAGALDVKRSLTVLAHSRRTRWFQEFIAFFPQCRMLMRILNHVLEHHAALRELAGWPVEYLTITVLRTQAGYHGITPADVPLAEAFWLILSTIASGCFLPGCPNGFKDPCERGAVDILGDLSGAERVAVTRGTAELLNRWLTEDWARVLDVEPLPGDPLYPPAAPPTAVPMEGVLENGKSADKAPEPDFASDTMLS
ncbi:zinc finger RNA-binding protein-like [Paramacrobiotus metropolitanus]|uniref:zinc finger RNA-binding protein-like n=1 Tax=Paramacrobiotus metropolitanus TaxID=2943436 RepID=UPI002445C678|nr:zinc finger RNA-binding protein-like [Paramacrobiotus metropolitanus]